VSGQQRWEEERGKNHRIPSKPLRNITRTTRQQQAERAGAGRWGLGELAELRSLARELPAGPAWARRPTARPGANGNDRTGLYVNKRSNRRAGLRVFSEMRQPVNGWNDIPAQRDALVPGKAGSVGKRSRGERPGRQQKR
jgi:hypothetical protein